jgi:UDP-2,4-diacetamido-2,4,6-trideoxy-beta-L-altropyranose hydrolase
MRLDSSEQIGSGHLTRCLALAEGLREQGANVVFASRASVGNLLALVERAEFRVLPVPDSPCDPDPSGNKDATTFMAGADAMGGKPDWLVIDHYGIGRMWETQMRPYVRSIAVIDDLADREHECDVLIDANFHPDSVNRYADKLPAHCVQLLGPKYALLRGEFLQERAHLQNRTGLVRRIQAQRVQAQRMLAQPILAQRIQIQRILVFFGGVDLSNQTLKALGAIASLDRREIATDVVVGATNPHRGSVQEFCATHPDFAFHCQTAEMAMLMGQADLAIGAGGTTMWERCAMGLPSLVVTVAENQVPSTAAMACEGLLRYLGSSTEVSQSMIAHALLGLLEKHDEAMRMRSMLRYLR